MLLDNRSLARPYFEGRGIGRIVSGHFCGDRNFTTELHRLLSLELLYRLSLDAGN